MLSAVNLFNNKFDYAEGIIYWRYSSSKDLSSYTPTSTPTIFSVCAVSRLSVLVPKYYLTNKKKKYFEIFCNGHYEHLDEGEFLPFKSSSDLFHMATKAAKKDKER